MKVFLLDHNSIMADIAKMLPRAETVEQADVVVLWNDVNPFERGVVSYARSLGKKTVVMQHGRRGTSRYFPPFCEKIQADKLLVWGEFDKRRLIKAGQDPKKITVTGTTVLDHIVQREPHEGTNIVFCPEHWDRPVEENRKVRNQLRRLKNVQVITKIIESHNAGDFDNPVQTNRNSSEHLDVCARVLSTADLVVGISESTFELMAQAMDIPVVIMEEWTPKAFGGDMRYTHYERLISPASKRAALRTLRETIQSQLLHPEELREQRKLVAVDEGGYGLNAHEKIIQALN